MSQMQVNGPGEWSGAEGLVVAWDTCTPRGTLAVGSGDVLLSETYFKTEKGHTGWLMPLVALTLGRAGFAPGNIDYVAVGTGPGTFTGVKVGLTTAKAVATACSVPLVGVSTLDILAAGAPGGADLVLSTIDARRGMLYAAAYRPANGVPERISEYICDRPCRVAEMALTLGYESVAVVGEAPPTLTEPLGEGGGLTVGDDPLPRGREVLSLSDGLIAGGSVGDAASVAPVYLKKPI